MDRTRNKYIEYLERVESTSPEYTKEEENVFLDRMSFSLGHRRSRLEWKTYVTASSMIELKEVLSGSMLSPVRSTAQPRIAFVFTGQGVQWGRMGIDLLQYPVYYSCVAAAEAYLREELGCEWSVMEELQRWEESSFIQFARFSQPLCTILQVALVDLFHSWDVKPEAVVGHSSGEIGAAYCYGAISREHAWKISYWRGKLCSGLRSEVPELKGAMMAVGLSAEAAQQYIPKLRKGKVVVACVNSPSSVEFQVITRIEDQEPQENGSRFVSIRYKADRNNQWVTGANLEVEALKQEFSDTKEKCTHRIGPAGSTRLLQSLV